jgi:hypothetical protein
MTMDETPLTAATFRAELKRHRWATWRGLWAIILVLFLVSAVVVSGR